jgi:phage terminase large subunit
MATVTTTIKAYRTAVYDKNLASAKRYLVNIGGAGSSKSYSIAQLLVNKFLSIQNRKIAVTRKTFPALRITSYRLCVSILAEYGLMGRIRHDKMNHEIINPFSGSMMAFLSVDDPEKMKSTDWNDIWMEEATEFTWADWIIMQTRLRSKTDEKNRNQIYLSLNPSDEQSWINQKLMTMQAFTKDVEIIHSTYRDNPFLDKDYVQTLINLKDQDPNAYDIYAEGKWGRLTNLIYQPWELEDEWPHVEEKIYGLDFGFNNPSALVEIGIRDMDEIHVRQLIYERHLTNGMLIERCKELIKDDDLGCPIYADTAEPDRIEEFSNAGFNIYPSDKDVKLGIDFLKRKRIHTLPENVDINKERAAYKWRTDKNGNVLDEPVKFMDHAMDAIRYGLFTHQKNLVSADWIG